MFENWFHKHFDPEVQAILKERGLPQKAVLLLMKKSQSLKFLTWYVLREALNTSTKTTKNCYKVFTAHYSHAHCEC